MEEKQVFHKEIGDWYRRYGDQVDQMAKDMWAQPEISLEEFKACQWTKEFMEEQGFQVETYHCKDDNLPHNTVIATAGSGSPVIGFYGEYDALPNMGQEAVPYRAPKEGAGHGCGHCLMTPACASAAAAAWHTMKALGLKGTIRFIATPAEETVEGKPLLMKKGAFEGLDCCLSWHPTPWDLMPAEGVLQAASSYQFEFFGTAAHAAISPEAGRSALEAAELMNVGVQYLRGHVTNDVRIGYTYLNTGGAANVVPEYASTHYYIRAMDMDKMEEVAKRVCACAEGAATMTGTTCKATLLQANSETAIVHSFNRFLFESTLATPMLKYGPEEEEFARQLHKSVFGEEGPDPLPHSLEAPTGVDDHYAGSTDAGYLTKLVPTARLYGLGIVRDMPGHHWGVVASVGTGIGRKAALYVGQCLAQCAVETALHPEKILEWKKELHDKVGDVVVRYPGDEL